MTISRGQRYHYSHGKHLLRKYAAVMSRTGNREATEPATCTLGQLCNRVVTCSLSYEDAREAIAERLFEAIQGAGAHDALEQVGHVVSFLEGLENKNEECARNLADVYGLMGEACQWAENDSQSVAWFEKAIVLNDRSPLLFQSMADALARLGRGEAAERAYRQAIRLAPGDYSTYLKLAGVYEKLENPEAMEECLERLLERDPGNMQALHMLIIHHHRRDSQVDVEFLRRRLLSTGRALHKKDLLIWAYHMCEEGRVEEVPTSFNNGTSRCVDDVLDGLVRAYAYGKLRRYAQRKRILQRVADMAPNSPASLEAKLKEFTAVFGEEAAKPLRKVIAARTA